MRTNCSVDKRKICPGAYEIAICKLCDPFARRRLGIPEAAWTVEGTNKSRTRDVVPDGAEIGQKACPVVFGPLFVEAWVREYEVPVIPDVLRLSHVLQMMDDLTEELEGLSERRLAFNLRQLGQGVEQGLSRISVGALLGGHRARQGKRPVGR